MEEDSIQLGVESVDNEISYANFDVDWVERNGSWNFNSHLLVLNHLIQGENPLTVQLTEVSFWILVNDIPHGFMSEVVAKQLGNFVGTFLEYDTSVVQLAYGGIIRLRVRLDVGHGESFCPIRAINPNQEYEYKWYISLRAQSKRTMAWRSQLLVEDSGEKGPSYANSSFDGEMAIREEENSPMHNLDGLKRPRTLSFTSGVSANKD
ncbi:hypothetical protein Gotri_010995 [Gossypium trilobum]|uniref:DUF4283 domain-containing protein n=1 Tax=Gossypium trilobum TaxID=34281 RepID=A0A7J9ES85_9ROSI|nr:hypothetical protein [Gossypium trilobum]